MGSKRSLLRNGLGELVLARSNGAARFVDLFGGTGAVGSFVAQRVSTEVVSVDLQRYSAALAGSIILRTRSLDASELMARWLGPAIRGARRSARWKETDYDWSTTKRTAVNDARKQCALPSLTGPIWQAYGGYYFSPRQSLMFDFMLKHLPDDEAERAICTAALVRAASRCAASPGHTAQPFRPTATALPSIRAAWSRDPIAIATEALLELAPQHAKRRGRCVVGDANDFAHGLKRRDLVFIDPPYSAAQYSRFYHVLETMAAGSCGPVEGAGRYPPPNERPTSQYSLKAGALDAVTELLELVATAGCGAIMTFPQHQSSNGMSGEQLLSLARSRFRVDAHAVSSRFSTMGGNGSIRASRHRSTELILSLTPKVSSAHRFSYRSK